MLGDILSCCVATTALAHHCSRPRVQVVAARYRKTGKMFAIKIMDKAHIVRENKTRHAPYSISCEQRSQSALRSTVHNFEPHGSV